MDSLNERLLDTKDSLNENLQKQLLIADKRLANADQAIKILATQSGKKESLLKLQRTALLGIVAGLITYIIIK